MIKALIIYYDQYTQEWSNDGFWSATDWQMVNRGWSSHCTGWRLDGAAWSDWPFQIAGGPGIWVEELAVLFSDRKLHPHINHANSYSMAYQLLSALRCTLSACHRRPNRKLQTRKFPNDSLRQQEGSR